jgi:hypothetical protein
MNKLKLLLQTLREIKHKNVKIKQQVEHRAEQFPLFATV